jgi:SNF2 family DNA or RNA helicase
MEKLADLLPEVELQEHQKKLLKRDPNKNLLLLHSLGSGKTLSSIALAE